MKPIECKCFKGCSFGAPFLVYVPDEIENRLTGMPYLNDGGEAIERGIYICHNGHISDEMCVMGDGSDRVEDGLPIGTWRLK